MRTRTARTFKNDRMLEFTLRRMSEREAYHPARWGERKVGLTEGNGLEETFADGCESEESELFSGRGGELDANRKSVAVAAAGDGNGGESEHVEGASIAKHE